MNYNPLQELIAASAADPAREPQFLAELLEAPLFVHLPLLDDGEKVQLVKFTRLDGLTVIPVFSAFDRAYLAAQGNVRVATVPGRELMEATRGATLMLDPNDTSCTLYPEEITALLDEGIAVTAPIKTSSGECDLGPAESRHAWIADVAVDAIRHIEGVHVVWLAQRVDQASGAPPNLVVILGLATAQEERAIRALGLALASRLRDSGLTVDATTVDPYEETKAWPIAVGLKPHWQRMRVS